MRFIFERNYLAIDKRKASEAVLNVYTYPSQKVLQLNNIKEGFMIKGRAANANEVVQHASFSFSAFAFWCRN
jgi:hypothetical protein